MQAVINTQKAIYTLLSAELDEDIYDHVPKDAAFPYVTIGDSSLRVMPHTEKDIYEIEISIHAYDEGRGRKNLLLIADSIYDLLNNQPLTVESYTHYQTILTGQEIELIDTGKKYALSATYKIVVA